MRKRRILIWIAALMAFLLVLCLMLAMFLILESRPKSKAVNDADLIFSRMEIPGESNAFQTLLKATNELYWPESLWSELGDLSDNTNWDDSMAADALARNRGCLELFSEAMQKRFLLIPEPKEFAEDHPYLSDWRTISRVKSIEAIALFRARKEKQAFDSA